MYAIYADQLGGGQWDLYKFSRDRLLTGCFFLAAQPLLPSDLLTHPICPACGRQTECDFAFLEAVAENWKGPFSSRSDVNGP